MAHNSILVIDDEPGMLRIMERAPEAKGYAVTTAENVVELLEKNSTVQPDLILLDVMMPWMSGYTACHKLRARYNDCPVIMVSALSQRQDIERGLWCGADEYLTKPLNYDALFESIARLLNPQVENIT